MTNEQILEQQVEALEKLLQLKEAVIGELEKKVQTLQTPIINVPNYAPSQWTVPNTQPNWVCTDGNPHQYPQYWGGTCPPTCTKCGQPPNQTYGGSWITVHPGSQQLPAGGLISGGNNISISSQNGLPIHTTGYVHDMNAVAQDNSNLFTLVHAANK